MDSTRLYLPCHVCRCVGLAAVLITMPAPAVSFADGALVGQKAQPGEIVVIRNVAARPADRNPTALDMALMVNTSLNPQLNNAINGSGGSGEITDMEIADLTAGVVSGNGATGQSSVQRSLNAALGTNTGGNTAGVAGNGISNLMSGSTGSGGSVAENTRNIGDQVTNDVSQIPMLGAER